MILQLIAITSLAAPSGALVKAPCTDSVSNARPPVNSTVVITVHARWNYHVYMKATANAPIAEHTMNANHAGVAVFDLHISPALKNVPIRLSVSDGSGDHEGICVTRIILPT